MSRDADVPKTFMVEIEIQRQVVRYSNALAGDIDTSTSSSLLNLFNNELDTLYSLYKGFWCTKLEIQLLRAKLYLYSHCLNVASKSKGQISRLNELSDLESVKILVHHGLHSAVSLIHNINKLNTTSPVGVNPIGESGSLIHYPKFYLQLVMFAVVFLLKFLSTNTKASQQDRELALSHITTAHQLFSSFPNSPEHARIVQVIELLVRNLKENENDIVPPIRTKLGASLMFDTLKDLRSRRIEDDADDCVQPNAVDALPNWRGTETGLATASHHLVNSIPPVWEPVGLNNGFVSDHSGMQEDIGGIQWISDEMFFEMTGLQAGMAQ